jgi:phosphoserine phosphatase
VLDVVTPEQFHKSILSSQPKVAVFDCDGTLWDGDTGSEFMVWTIATGLVSRETADWIDDRYRLYRKGELSEIAICGEMVQMYAGLTEAEVRHAARTFFQQRFEHLIFPEMLTLAQQLLASGAEIWAVSSTNTWVVEEGSERFGIPAERVLAAKTRVTNQIITPELLDVPTGQGKVDSLRRAGVRRPDVVFGNSVHDAAMLSIAGHAVAIHPSTELRAHVEREGWAIHMPAPQSTV